MSNFVILYCVYFLCLYILSKEVGNAQAQESTKSCSSFVSKYDEVSCNIYWSCTVEKLLRKIKFPIQRSSLSNLQPKDLGHTPLWLRVSKNKLHCVLHPNLQLQASNLRLKPYRALHYINRINLVLKSSRDLIPDETEWWSHQSDWAKIPAGKDMPPVFSISGAEGYADLPGIPFMSFTDKLAKRESEEFRLYDGQFSSDTSFLRAWKKKKNVIYFRGGLTDCAIAEKYHNGDARFCARAKIVLEKVRGKSKLLSGVSTYTRFSAVGLQDRCDDCLGSKLGDGAYVKEMVGHKYLLNFPGAGNWSRS